MVCGGVGGVGEHLIRLPPLPKCCDYRHMPPPAGLLERAKQDPFSSPPRSRERPCFPDLSVSQQEPPRGVLTISSNCPCTPLDLSPGFLLTLEGNIPIEENIPWRQIAFPQASWDGREGVKRPLCKP